MNIKSNIMKLISMTDFVLTGKYTATGIMNPLNKNLAYDCSNLSEEEMRELMNKEKFYFTPKKIYYNEKYDMWFHVDYIYGTHITNFTDAKTLFE